MLLPVSYCLLLALVVATALAMLRRRPTARLWMAGLAALGLSALVLVALLAPFDYAWYGQLAGYTLFGHFAAYLLFAAFCLGRKHFRLAVLSAAGGTALLAVALDAYWIEPHWLEIGRYEFRSPKLKRAVRVVLIADLQTDAFGDYERRALSAAVAERPDLVLFAGDYVQTPANRRSALRQEINRFLKQLDIEAPLGVYAVRGNIERGNWAEMFSGLGMQIVEKTGTFELDDLRLTCLGCSDSFDSALRLPEAPPGRFHLVLGHSPNYALGPLEADLCLAGHTHGGQVRLPFLGAVITLSEVPRRLAAGLNLRPLGGWMLVARGVGMERGQAPRLRFLCRPELAVIDLLPE